MLMSKVTLLNTQPLTEGQDLFRQLNLSPYLKIRIPQRDKCESFEMNVT